MQIQVTFRHTDPSEPLKEYAHEKLGKLQKYLDGPVEANVKLSVEKHRHLADVTIFASGLKIHGSETTGDLYSAIDLCVDKMEKQVKRYREKLKNFNKSSRKAAELSYKLDIFEAESVSQPEPSMITTTTMTAKPMDVDEAAMQLDLSQDEFLVFTDARSEKLNVIYRRSDGNFGLIVPEQ